MSNATSDNDPCGLSAGSVAASSRRYVVICTHRHLGLKIGDIVVMLETPRPRFDNYLLRVSDMTLHSLEDESDQYVHLTEAP